MTLSEKGAALRDIMLHVEETDIKMKKLTEELLFEFNKKEALIVIFKQLTSNLK